MVWQTCAPIIVPAKPTDYNAVSINASNAMEREQSHPPNRVFPTRRVLPITINAAPNGSHRHVCTPESNPLPPHHTARPSGQYHIRAASSDILRKPYLRHNHAVSESHKYDKMANAANALHPNIQYITLPRPLPCLCNEYIAGAEGNQEQGVILPSSDLGIGGSQSQRSTRGLQLVIPQFDFPNFYFDGFP